MLDWKTFRQWHKHSGYGHTRVESRKEYNKQLKEEKMNSNCFSIPCAGQTISGTMYNVMDQYISSPSHTHSLSTVECAPATPKEHYVPGFWTVNEEKGNNPMNYATATVQAGTTETQDQRKYLSRRLEEIYFKLERPLFAQFGLADDNAPKTPKELKQRIADGKFTIIGLPKDGEDEDEDADDFWYGGWTRLIKWRDPAKKADQDGYEAAMKDLKASYQAALDTIKIDEPKAGLDAVKAFEEWKPTGAAN